jgi:hypothetical protein
VLAVQRSNEQATVQVSRIIKKAARELVGSHKLIQYREREKKEQRSAALMVTWQPSEGQPQQLQQLGGGGGGGGHGSPKKSRVEEAAAPVLPLSLPLPLPLPQQEKEVEGAEAAEATESSEGGSEAALTEEELLDSLLPSVHCEESAGAGAGGEATYSLVEGAVYEKKVEELAEVLNDLLPAEAVEPLRVVGEGRGSARQLEDRQVRNLLLIGRSDGYPVDYLLTQTHQQKNNRWPKW